MTKLTIFRKKIILNEPQWRIQSNLPYRSPQINDHLCLAVTLITAHLLLLFILTLFNGHLSNAANGHV